MKIFTKSAIMAIVAVQMNLTAFGQTLTGTLFQDAGTGADWSIGGTGESLEIREPEDGNKIWARFIDDNRLELLGTPNLHIGGYIRGNQSGALRVDTGNGYIDIGPKNTGWAHFYTDRPRYFFDKEIRVNSGLIGSYDENLQLMTAGTTRMTLKTDGNVGVGCDPGDVTFKIYKSDLPYFELASSVSRLQIGMATCDWCFASEAKSGDAVIRTLGGRNTTILNIPNDNNDGNSFIGVGDYANGIWFKIRNDRTLRMDGKLYAKEINVQTDVWSDCVFQDNYGLKTLEEVENFIKKNKHLPDVPPEREVMEKGVNVGEMNAILLKKIEELTLYVIEQEKKIQIIQNQLDQLKR